ncbi:MAG: helix-turn-helix transcriptional regulator [Planctomycetota bacterium]
MDEDDGARIAAALARLLASGPVRRVHRAGLAMSGSALWQRNLTQHPRIVLALQGRHAMLVSGRPAVLHLSPGEALLMPAGSANVSRPGRRRRYCSLTLQADGLRPFMRHHDGQALASSPAWVTLIPGVPGAADRRLWQQALAWEAADPALPGLLTAICWRMLAIMQAPVEAGGGAAASFRRCCAWLAQTVPDLPTRDELAARCGLHPGYVSALFRQHAGCSLQEYCRRLRLSFAHELLRGRPDLPVLQVAAAAGFADLRHFRRHFRARYGHPPRGVGGLRPGRDAAVAAARG